MWGWGGGGSRGSTQGVRQKRREREVRAQMRTGGESTDENRGPLPLARTASLLLAAGFKRVTGQASNSLAGSLPLCPGKTTVGGSESCGL